MKEKMLNGEIFDTEKLSDIQQLIAEKQIELYKLCTENDVNCFLVTEANLGNNRLGNLTWRGNQERMRSFHNMMNNALWVPTNGQFGVCFIARPPEEEWKK